jgi:arylsulfatase A
MDWSHGHNGTIHNGISRIGYYTGGHAARFRDEDLADKWVEQSVEFIEANKDRPFFLFFASHDLHVPRMPHERFQGATSLGYRGDAIVELDWCVGELTNTLERLGIAENTLVVFCSDNGPVLDDGYKDGAVEMLGAHQPAGPYSGGKYSVQEGGTRTPFITWWPGTIEPGVSDNMVCTIDLAASAAALAGVDVPDGACIDSENVLAALLGKPDAKGRQELIQQDNGNSGALGFRRGEWKLQRKPVGKNKRQGGGPAFEYQLFDLSKDPAEKLNVAAKNKEVLQQMIARLNEIVGAM